MKRSIVTVVIIVVVAIISFFIGRNTCVDKPEQKSLSVAEKQKVALFDTIKAEKHEITFSDAEKLLKNYSKATPKSKIKGGSFQRAILDKILSQPDCDGIRYYYAQNDDGTPTIVLVGITAKGIDITKGAMAEKSLPCPPWCSGPH